MESTVIISSIIRLVLLWASLFVIIFDMSVDTLALVPSQTIRARSNNQKQKYTSVSGLNFSLIPSQVLIKKHKRVSELSTAVRIHDADGVRTEMQDWEQLLLQTTRTKRKQKRSTKKNKASPLRSKHQHTKANSTSGNWPDIFSGAIPMDHLRQHPNYRPLPEAEFVSRRIQCLEDVRFFRQDSWQWDALHNGRTTTSQAAAALGFLEDHAAEVLGIPRSWRKGGTGAFLRLRQPALRTWKDMQRVLFVDAASRVTSTDPKDSYDSSSVWIVSNDGNQTFAAKYQAQTTHTATVEKEKIHVARKFSQNEQLAKSIRMMWGNVQEATAILTALNYFWGQDPDVVVEEIGMCGAGLELNISSSMLIGASPDGIIRHSDGKVEVLEVKNHCPFYTNKVPGKNKGGSVKRFFLGSQPIDGGVFPHYVPQLQLEMLCVGTNCRSAVMIRQTATHGALILRMHRDDEWIKEMLYWLQRFHEDFVDPNRPPPKNFFWDASKAEDRARYRRFVNRTNQIRHEKVEIVCQIDNAMIQRCEQSPPLFLDP